MNSNPHRPASIAVIGPGRLGSAILASAAAADLQGVSVDRMALAAGEASHCEVALLTVPDREIAEVCERLVHSGPTPRLVGHTSGATPLRALDAAAVRGAGTFSLHPLQTVSGREAASVDGAPAKLAGAGAIAGAPCAVTATDGGVEAEVDGLVRLLGMKPFSLADEARVTYHAAASMASNFLIALEETAAELLDGIGIDGGRELLAPLIARTVENWQAQGVAALTGPIARGDEATVRAHLTALAERFPEAESLYLALADRTRTLAAEAVGS